MHATCSTILHDLIILMMLTEEYRG